MSKFKIDPSVDESTTRRDFLKALSVSSAAALAFGAPRLLLANEAEGVAHLEPTADTCILLWMGGGMAAPETFDPKKFTAFEKGVPVEQVECTFPAIDTVLDGVQISEGLEHIAQVLDRGTLIRSHVQPDLGNILHSRHQYHWHTGYVPPQTVAAPHMGAWMAKLLGPKNRAIPAFIDIGQELDSHGEKEELKAFHTAGFLGSEFGPFVISNPSYSMHAVRPPFGMTPGRFANRYKHYKKLVEASPTLRESSDYQKDSMLQAMDNAHRLLTSPERKAFDLSLEPKESAEIYGESKFGKGCLLARRLTEAGARFIEVTTEYVPFLHWDTHENGHETLVRMKQEIDRPVAQLIRDLESRKLLDRTLVILASEFSRDMIIEGVPGSTAKDQSRAKSDTLEEPIHYGLHRHFTGGTSLLMFGGGIKAGQVYGETATQRPFVATKNPISITDLHATIYTAMGISPATALDIEKRPFYVTEDGKGQSVRELFA